MGGKTGVTPRKGSWTMSKRIDIYLAGSDSYEASVGGVTIRIHGGTGPDQPGPYQTTTEIPDNPGSGPSILHVFVPSHLPAAITNRLSNFIERLANFRRRG